MRIDKNQPSHLHKGAKGKGKKADNVKNVFKNGFQEQLERLNQKEIKEKLDQLLSLVDEHGEKLKKSLDKKDLVAYKKSVKEFLKVVQKEFARAKQSYSWDARGNMRSFTIIEQVENKLELLTELFIEEQADSLEVLKRIGEIRGLLLDLYI